MATIDVKDAAGLTRAIEAPNGNGQASKANSRPVTLASDDDVQAKLGAPGEAAPTTDTAPAGLNGRLQRVAQRLTTLAGQMPATLGQNIKGGSLSVTVASDQGALAISAAALPLPVGAATGAQQDTGNTLLGSIDTKTPALIAGKVPVDGSGVTQPVSAATLSLPTGAATGARQDTGNTSLGSIDGKLPALAAGRVPVDGSGVTQPVSIAAMPTTSVTGAFYQATQPVSLAVNTPTLAAGSAVVGKVGIDQATPGTSNGVSGPALAKGAQGATGFSTQDLKDAGRTLFAATTAIGGVTAVASEALLSVVPTRAGVAAAAVTSLAVTAGKTLRATAILAGVRSNAATVLSGRVALRMSPSGAVTATSPIIAILSLTQQAAALAEAGDTCTVALPDGLEFTGAQQIGLTQVCSGTGGVVYASIVGFEY